MTAIVLRPLSMAFRKRFDPAVVQRGADYAARGAVRIVQRSPTHVEAIASGAQDYGVTLEVRGEVLVVSCACPYFVDRDLCKHVWAALLVVDGGGHLRGAGPLSTLRRADDAETAQGDDAVLVLPLDPRAGPDAPRGHDD